MELLIAFIPMLAWGSIGLVSGKMGGDANQQTLGMTTGAFLFSLALFFILRPTLDLRVAIVGFISGLFWCLGQNNQFHAMNFMGVSVALPLSTGMQLVLNTVAGALLFREWQKPSDFLFGAVALVLLIGGAYLTSKQDPDQKESHPSGKMYDFGKGFRSLLISSVGYALYTIIVTWAGLDPLAIVLPQSFGMLVGAACFSYGKVKVDKFVWRNTVTGLLWGIGNICMLLSIQTIGLAVAFSLSQMGIIISTLGGIFLLGEHKTSKELRYVIIGCILVIFGGIILGYMKSMA